MYHYAANNPVKYTDPDGREADDKTAKKIDNLETFKFRRPLTKDIIDMYKAKGWTYMKSQQESSEKNAELKRRKESPDWYITSETIDEYDVIVTPIEPSLTELLKYNQGYGENPTGRTQTEKRKRTITIYKAETRDSDTGKTSQDYFDVFLDANNDGYVDFYMKNGEENNGQENS